MTTLIDHQYNELPQKQSNYSYANDSICIIFFFGKMIFIVCEQKNRQKNTNKCYIQHT